MTCKLCVHWTLTPAHPPSPWRHCAACGVTRAFVSSGNVRLNANGRKLDAWLIYRCSVCDRTWLRTLVERRSVQHIPQAELEAMQQSSEAWVRRHEFDVAALKRHAGKITYSDGLEVIRPVRRKLAAAPGAIELTMVVVSATGLRLDRFLAAQLPISRARLRTAHANGGLLVNGCAGDLLRRKISSDLMITLMADAFSEAEFSLICQAVFVQ